MTDNATGQPLLNQHVNWLNWNEKDMHLSEIALFTVIALSTCFVRWAQRQFTKNVLRNMEEHPLESNTYQITMDSQSVVLWINKTLQLEM